MKSERDAKIALLRLEILKTSVEARNLEASERTLHKINGAISALLWIMDRPSKAMEGSLRIAEGLEIAGAVQSVPAFVDSVGGNIFEESD
jgi:hypothetical protein